MIYLIAGALCTFYGLSCGLGSVTLLRPLLDAIAPFPPLSVSVLCTMASLSASLISAFFALTKPIPFAHEDLILLASGSALGGIAGELAAARFLAMLPAESSVLLQNALLLTLTALAALGFGPLARTLRPYRLARGLQFPVAACIGVLASFLAFGAEPVSMLLFFLLFDAGSEDSSFAALTIALCAMAGKLLVLLIRMRLYLPHAEVLLWLLPGVLLGALAAMAPRIQRLSAHAGDALLKLSIFTSLLNVAASAL